VEFDTEMRDEAEDSSREHRVGVADEATVSAGVVWEGVAELL
jgi:hypothetical protein